MGDGKHCPSCGKDIGVWPVFSAIWSNLIWCPHCKSRLRYRKTGIVIVVLFAVGIVIAACVFVIVRALEIAWPRSVWAAIVLIFWVPVQLALARFLRNRRQLELVNQSRTGS
jgi:uncharacterized protein (DUF983 family)